MSTQAQLAKKLGLSRSTIAAALNPNSSVKLRAETRERIMAEAARLNYRPHRYAQVMRKGRSGMIGIFHYGGLSQVAAERVWFAAQAVRAAGYTVLINDGSWSSGGARAGCEAMLDARVEGVVIAGLNDPSGVEDLQALPRAGIPVVSLSGNALPGTPFLRGDARDAMKRLTRHLLRLGRRRLLLLMAHNRQVQPGTYVWAGEERLKGFHDALGKARARVVRQFSRKTSQVEARVVTVEGTVDLFNPFEVARDSLAAVLSQGPQPDAVICGNDDWAIGALAACRDAGLRVPEDVALTGYDNTSVGAFLDVPLTTVQQPSQTMAERAVEILLKLVRGEKFSRSAVLTFPCELIIRASCGAQLPARPTSDFV